MRPCPTVRGAVLNKKHLVLAGVLTLTLILAQVAWIHGNQLNPDGSANAEMGT